MTPTVSLLEFYVRRHADGVIRCTVVNKAHGMNEADKAKVLHEAHDAVFAAADSLGWCEENDSWMLEQNYPVNGPTGQEVPSR